MQVIRKVKSLRSILIPVLAGLLLASVFSGCGPSTSVTDETDERAYRRGKSLLREGRHEEALQAFLSLINARPDAAESHLEAGLLYLDHIKDPLAAIYHFRSYLALDPSGQYAKRVEDLIVSAQKDFAQQLPGEPFGDEVERVNLMETVKTLQEENTALKERIIELQNQLTDRESRINRYQRLLAEASEDTGQSGQLAPIIIQTPPEETGREAGAPETYTVQPGDTLSRISAKVYGQSGRWMDIFQANRDQLPSPNALQPGQVLRIP